MSTPLAADGLPIPPERLIVRAGATPGGDPVREYLRSGGPIRETLLGVLERHGRPGVLEAPRILDFGCGAGNVLRHFGDEARRGEVWGCDIDPVSVGWLQENLQPPFHAVVAGPSVAIPVPTGHFDLAYAISVFTHIAEDWAEWLLELRRVLAPEGILLVSVLGEGMIEAERGGAWDPDRIGMNVLRRGQDWEGGGPTVFLSDWWIRAHWGRAFEILEVADERDASGAVVPGSHALVVMRPRAGSITAPQLRELEPGEPREVAALQHNIEQLHADDRRLRQELLAARQRADTEHGWRVSAEARADALARQLATITSGHSWRLTRPLRVLAERARREAG